MMTHGLHPHILQRNPFDNLALQINLDTHAFNDYLSVQLTACPRDVCRMNKNKAEYIGRL